MSTASFLVFTFVREGIKITKEKSTACVSKIIKTNNHNPFCATHQLLAHVWPQEQWIENIIFTIALNPLAPLPLTTSLAVSLLISPSGKCNPIHSTDGAAPQKYSCPDFFPHSVFDSKSSLFQLVLLLNWWWLDCGILSTTSCCLFTRRLLIAYGKRVSAVTGAFGTMWKGGTGCPLAESTD